MFDCSKDDTVSELASPVKNKSKMPRKVISSDLASALDRTGISDRSTAHVVCKKALGQDPADCVLNEETVQRTGRKNREKLIKSIKVSFDSKVLLKCTGMGSYCHPLL